MVESTRQSLSGMNLVVTGASSGIGRSIALAASQRGARVALVARREPELQAVFGELAGDGHLIVTADVVDFDRVPAMISGIAERMGALNALVHAAGVHAVSPLRAVTPKQVSRLLEANVTSGIMLTKAFRRPSIRAEEASIVLLSSAIGAVGASGVSAYAASKAAVASTAQSLALELARERIRVNAIAAGVVTTPLTDELRATVGTDAWRRIEDAHPLGLGSPDDIANAALFLASPEARWITGAVIPVDGGYTAQ